MGEMRFWHQFTEHLGGAAGIDEIAHHQPAAAIANNRGRLDDCGLVRLLRIVIVGSVADHTHGFDKPYVERAGDDRGRRQSAARYSHHPLPRAEFQEAPGESLGIPVQILPSSRKLSRGWGWRSWTFQSGCSEAMSIQVVAVAIFRATMFAFRRRVDELRQPRPEPLLCIGR